MTLKFETEIGRLDCFGLSETGRTRTVNSDQYLVGDLKICLRAHKTSLAADDSSIQFGNTHGQLLIVADGIGEQAGKHASTLAVEAVSSYLLNSLSTMYDRGRRQDDHLLGELKNALWECQSRMQREAARTAEPHTMGSTVTLAYVAWPRLLVLHVGDSRCYLFRNDRLEQLTTDHTFAQKMVANGVLEADRAGRSRWNNVLWNVVGAGCNDLEPEICEQDMRIGDALLLCTDGLTKHLSDHQIGRILAEDRSAEATCGRLVETALLAGGSDDITVVVARFRPLDRRSAETDGAAANVEDRDVATEGFSAESRQQEATGLRPSQFRP
jgi:PPM family protein phosphatase